MGSPAPTSDSTLLAAQLRQFLRWNILANALGLLITLMVYLFTGLSVLLFFTILVLANALLLTWAYRHVRPDNVAVPVLMFCAGLWAFGLAFALYLPMLGAQVVLLLSWPVVLALVYLDEREFRWTALVTVVLCVIAMLILQRPISATTQQLLDEVPAIITSLVLIFFTPLLLGLQLLLLGQYKHQLVGALEQLLFTNSALKESEHTLEQTVDQRTSELRSANDALIESQHALAEARDLALEASRAKSAFLATMSHELRTPLNAIIGYGEILAEEAEDQGYSELMPDIDRITTSGRHLLSLINNVLDLSKIEAGKMELLPDTLSIGPLISEMASTVRPLMAASGNTLEIDVPHDIGNITADPTKLRQILLNLLSNAAKFTHNGAIRLEVRRQQGAEREQVSFAVVDTGIGITDEQLSRLFQSFVQADASTTRKYGGTGLGLALSQRLAELHGGTITATSTPGAGSTFTLILPADTRPAAHEQPRHGAAMPSTRLDGTLTVLVIDDDESSRDLLTRYLEADGFDVATAADGVQGLEMAHVLRPDAIILDVLMPDVDGWGVLAQLKADPLLAHIPVVMASLIDEPQHAFSLGATDYLVKPINHTVLVDVLHRHLSGAIQPSQAHILIVEDDEHSRSMLRRAITQQGWSVAEAEHGGVALQQLQEHRPHLILLDLLMPEVDGFTLLEQLRASPRWQDIPVIVITAMDLTPIQRQRLNGSVWQVLQKGAYSREQLLEDIRDYLRDLHQTTGEASL